MLEKARGQKQTGSSLQSFVHIQLPATDAPSALQQNSNELADIFVVSSVTVGGTDEAVPDAIASAEWHYGEEYELPNGGKGMVYVYSPQAAKCPRCWRYVIPKEEVADDKACGRCEDVLQELDTASCP
jgi:isoleucyl-tRNA synthetase